MSQQKPKLHVIFDSNAIYAKTDGEDVIPLAIASLIKDPAHANLDVAWLIPDMVRLEREQHIRKNAQHAISLAEKLPKVFEGNWLLDPHKVDKEVGRVVSEALNELAITVLPCDLSRIEWSVLVDAAGRRKPPFDPDLSKEKGFKDAIVAETFLQHWSTLDPEFETSILVSGDKILREHVLRRTEGKNCRVIEDQDALRNELNFLASDVEASTAEQVKDAAAEFIRGKSDFWNAVVEMAIEESRLSNSDEGLTTSNTRVGSYQTFPPVFLSKTLRRLKFSTQIVIHRVADVWVEPKYLQPEGTDRANQLFLTWLVGSLAKTPDAPTPRRTWADLLSAHPLSDRLSSEDANRIAEALVKYSRIRLSEAESEEPSATLFPHVLSPIKATVHWSVEYEMAIGIPSFLPDTLKRDYLQLEA